MNFIPAWFTNFAARACNRVFCSCSFAVCLGCLDYKWGLMYDGRTHFWIRAAYIAAFILSGLFAVSAAV